VSGDTLVKTSAAPSFRAVFLCHQAHYPAGGIRKAFHIVLDRRIAILGEAHSHPHVPSAASHLALI